MKQGKYLFPSLEKAQEMAESIKSTKENPNKHTSFGLKPEKIAEVINEDGELEAQYSEKYQLDVVWVDLPNEGTEEEPIYKHPYGWKTYAVEISGEGNSRIAGVSYQANKI